VELIHASPTDDAVAERVFVRYGTLIGSAWQFQMYCWRRCAASLDGEEAIWEVLRTVKDFDNRMAAVQGQLGQLHVSLVGVCRADMSMGSAAHAAMIMHLSQLRVAHSGDATGESTGD